MPPNNGSARRRPRPGTAALPAARVGQAAPEAEIAQRCKETNCRRDGKRGCHGQRGPCPREKPDWVRWSVCDRSVLAAPVSVFTPWCSWAVPCLPAQLQLLETPRSPRRRSSCPWAAGSPSLICCEQGARAQMWPLTSFWLLQLLA